MEPGKGLPADRRRRRAARLVPIAAAAVVLAAIAGAAVLARTLENRIIYHPEVTPRLAMAGGPEGAEEVTFGTTDGLRLHGWIAGEQRWPYPLILYCHGNAGNITHRASLLAGMREADLAVFMFDYRGYGQSEGSPDEEGVYEDARSAYRWLVDVRGVEPGRIVVHGQSLGGAVAIDLAAHAEVAGLIVESSFTSVRDMAKKIFGPIPLYLIASSRFDSEAKVAGIGVPKLFMHGDMDDLIPYEMGVRLFEAAAEPKRFVKMEGADHNSGPSVMGDAYYDTIGEFARSAIGGAATSP